MEVKTFSGTLYNINQLPKDKMVLDFVLSKLGEKSSPERFEIISGLFTMYRTSTGFNPLAISKGRYKRMKSVDFRKSLQEIEAELDVVLQSDQYRQLVAKQTNYQQLFQNYTNLSDSLTIHPSSSMIEEVEEFENNFNRKEAYELLLNFYRQHVDFFVETKNADQLDEFINEFDLTVKKASQLASQTRINFVLVQLNQEYLNGKLNYKTLNETFKELENLLILETNQFTKNELLIKILKVGSMMPSPSNKLVNYLSYTVENIKSVVLLNDKHINFIYGLLARYHLSTTNAQRIEWIKIVEQSVKSFGQEADYAYAKLVKSIIEFDNKNFELGLRYLNEAEHQVHRSSWKLVSGRNVWITICEFRSYIFAIEHLTKKQEHTEAQFLILEKVASESSIHRYDSAVISLQLSAIRNFVYQNWDSSKEQFERALNYLNDVVDNPSTIICKYFVELLSGSINKKETATKIKILEELNEPFYSVVGIELIKVTSIYFKPKKKILANK